MWLDLRSLWEKVGRRLGLLKTSQAVNRAVLQRRLQVRVFFTKVKGVITGRPKIRPPEVLLQSSKRAMLLPRLKTRAQLSRNQKVFGKPTTNPPVRAPRTLLQSIRRPILLPRLHTLAFFLKHVFGQPTTRPGIRHIVTLLQAVRRLAYRPRSKAFFIRAVRSTVTVVNAFPHPIHVLRQAINRATLRYRTKVETKLGRVFGTPTKAPKARPLETLLQAEKRYAIRPKTRSFFVRAVRSTVVIIQVFPHAIHTLLQAVERRTLTPRIKTKSFFTRVYGHVTRTPKPKTTIIHFAAQERTRRQFINANALFTQHFGKPTSNPQVHGAKVVGFAAQARMRLRAVHGSVSLRRPAQAPIVTPPNLHKLFMDITTGKLYWRVDSASNPGLILPL